VQWSVQFAKRIAAIDALHCVLRSAIDVRRVTRSENRQIFRGTPFAEAVWRGGAQMTKKNDGTIADPIQLDDLDLGDLSLDGLEVTALSDAMNVPEMGASSGVSSCKSCSCCGSTSTCSIVKVEA
jgi:thiazolylpeptide-type bacteriocin precursor